MKQEKAARPRKGQKTAFTLFIFGFSLGDYFKVSNYAKVADVLHSLQRYNIFSTNSHPSVTFRPGKRPFSGTARAKAGLRPQKRPFSGTAGAKAGLRPQKRPFSGTEGNIGARNLWPPSATLEGGAPPPAIAERKGGTEGRSPGGFLHQCFPEAARGRGRPAYGRCGRRGLRGRDRG